MSTHDPFDRYLKQHHLLEKQLRGLGGLQTYNVPTIADEEHLRREASITAAITAKSQFDVARHALGVDPFSVTRETFLQAREQQEKALALANVTTRRIDIAALTSITAHSDAMRLIANPFHDAMKLGVGPSELQPGLSAALAARERYEHLFQRPDFLESARLAREALTVTSIADRYGIAFSAGSLTISMQAMHAPWMHPGHATLSVQSFTEIHAIGQALRMRNPFEEEVSAALRTSLGDWRAITTLPDAIFREPIARTSFYEQLGLDLSITDFPASAFDEATALAGFGLEIEVESEDDDEGDDASRSDRVAVQLLRFERRVRRWLDVVMTDAFGTHWIKHRVPGNLVQAWTKKREKEANAGLPARSLLEYADWGDYAMIIVRRDNWNDLFCAVFQRTDAVRESFTRIIPVRHCAMHGRLVTQPDELYARVEMHRILNAIERAQ